ncbi:hypothetical protein T492DRAFT_1143459 [Pavlovales sp. CCMP2436]|nr:hypothetical protein T492DRAFT_1143459 [Pavlovales sp. CCMP2436]
MTVQTQSQRHQAGLDSERGGREGCCAAARRPLAVDFLGTDDFVQVGIRRDQNAREGRREDEAARARSSGHAARPRLPWELEVGAVRPDDAARLLERTRCPRPRPAAPGLVGRLVLAVAALVHPVMRSSAAEPTSVNCKMRVVIRAEDAEQRKYWRKGGENGGGEDEDKRRAAQRGVSIDGFIKKIFTLGRLLAWLNLTEHPVDDLPDYLTYNRRNRRGSKALQG